MLATAVVFVAAYSHTPVMLTSAWRAVNTPVWRAVNQRAERGFAVRTAFQARMAAAEKNLQYQRPRAKQSLGQNFLMDESISRGMVGALEDVGDDVRVVELGPGQGALTSLLLAAHPRMLAVEIDPRMEPVLRANHPGLELRLGDMLQLDLGTLSEERGGNLHLITNTPFYLTSPFLFKLLGQLEHVDQVVLSMQSEVADKILAPARCKDYGILTVMVQLFGRPERLFEIPPEAFQPIPKCSASVLRLRPCAVPLGVEGAAPLSVAQRSQILGLLKLAFEQRRKMLRHTLKPLLAKAAVAPPEEMLRLRPEQLEPAQFIELAAMLFGDDESDMASELQAAHVSGSWKPYKAGWRPPEAAAVAGG